MSISIILIDTGWSNKQKQQELRNELAHVHTPNTSMSQVVAFNHHSTGAVGHRVNKLERSVLCVLVYTLLPAEHFDLDPSVVSSAC